MVAVFEAGITDPVRWELMRARIEADREQRGTYSCALIRAAAAVLNRSTRTIRRWLEEDPRRRVIFVLTDEQMAYIRLHKGNVAEAWHQLNKAGLVPVSEKTFRRAFNRLAPGVRDGLRRGKRDMRDSLPCVTLPSPTERNEIWEIDHALLKEIVVRDPHTNRRGHPWLTVIIDVKTRMLVGFSITLGLRREDGKRAGPTSESAFAALADAMLGRDYDGTFVGGKPKLVRFDQGRDFMYPVAEALDRFDIETAPAPADTPQHKPYVERVIGTIRHRILPPLPGFGIELEEAA